VPEDALVQVCDLSTRAHAACQVIPCSTRRRSDASA
jgi:hypothetical protein